MLFLYDKIRNIWTVFIEVFTSVRWYKLMSFGEAKCFLTVWIQGFSEEDMNMFQAASSEIKPHNLQ